MASSTRHRIRYRCGITKCRTRFAQKKRAKRAPKCSACGDTIRVRNIEQERRRELATQTTCHCPAYPFPHRAGSMMMCDSHPNRIAVGRLNDRYPDGFFHWLPKNSKVYREFERRALRMARTGRKRYSARTLVEAMRWDSDIADSEKTFKINDHYTPGMARLFMATHSAAYPSFFELR